MSWDSISVLAEVVSAVAVVVTLIFLIVELRRNRLATESASVDRLSEGWNTINGHVLDDPDFAHVFFEGLADPESLTPSQRDRFILLFQSYTNHFTTVKKHYDDGTLPQEIWDYHASGMSVLANSPGGKFACAAGSITPAVRAVFESYEGEYREDYLDLLKRAKPASE